MRGPFDRQSTRARRALIPAIAVAGIGAAVTAAALPAGAAPAAHHGGHGHHHAEHHRLRHIEVEGLVAGHHGRTITVFAHTTKVGTVTHHNRRVTVHFASSAHGRTRIPTGDHVRLTALGTISGHHVTVRHANDETVSATPATLFVGTVTAVNGSQLTVAERDRDNGDHADGDDHDVNGDARPADHSPGGPGDDGDNSGHQITVDDTNATITVDGAAGTVMVGNTVAVLGEVTNNTVVASSVYGFSTPTAFLRGDITAVSGDTVTVGDNDGHDNHDNVARHDGGGDDDSPVTLSLTGVPLALNGDVGATNSELVVGDKLVVLGTVGTAGAFSPELAFAFNRHDDQPCGDNDGAEHHHRHGGDDG